MKASALKSLFADCHGAAHAQCGSIDFTCRSLTSSIIAHGRLSILCRYQRPLTEDEFRLASELEQEQAEFSRSTKKCAAAEVSESSIRSKATPGSKGVVQEGFVNAEVLESITYGQVMSGTEKRTIPEGSVKDP